MGVHRMAKIAGAAWKALSEQEKAPFKAQASADKQRHQQESACQALLPALLLPFAQASFWWPFVVGELRIVVAVQWRCTRADLVEMCFLCGDV